MRFLVKKCNKCKNQFRTRPFYDKEHCRKCWNNIRTKLVYRTKYKKRRILFVQGNLVESKRQWVLRNKEKNRIYKNNNNHNRRIQSQSSDISPDWLLETKKHALICPVCNRKMKKDGREMDGKTLDHKVPLSRGGRHIKKNVWIICRRCNIKKGQKILNNL